MMVEKVETASSFWQAINILIMKPHVVNKRLWGSKVLCKHTCKLVPQNFEVISDYIRKLKNDTNTELTFKELFEDFNVKQRDETVAEVEILLLELLPKSYNENHAFQFICIQKTEITAKFIDATPLEMKQNLCPRFSYTFCLKNHEIALFTAPDVSEKSKQWLKNTVLPQVNKWNKEFLGHNNKICNESLALVSQDKYYEKYNHLKLKYGKEMVKMWPECTDPTKFVYEDVAISTYLLLLWEEEMMPQTFVDVGCGNGLLVYILTMEGHNGLGVDVRKRKIWDMYPDNIKLKEMTITPTNIHTISHGNWIIGNHSDELTPWIPVIAARTSYKCNFFLLPCCAYNFDGTKYQRQNSSKSQYTEYLEYIQILCEKFGFKTKIDRLKIPSTKRICLISTNRMYKEDEYDKYCDAIQDMVKKQIRLSNNDIIDNELKDFRTRDTVEKVRNCTQIDKGVTENIIKCITSYLLEGCVSESDWSKGKTVQISELVELLPSDVLKALKSECGGLQTLLRNHHHIFVVQKGSVQLRFPRTIDEVKKNMNVKNGADVKMQVKKCWFYNYHPQGCPLDSSVCSFLHENL